MDWECRPTRGSRPRPCVAALRAERSARRSRMRSCARRRHSRAACRARSGPRLRRRTGIHGIRRHVPARQDALFGLGFAGHFKQKFDAMSPAEKQEVLKKVALLMEQMTRAETEGRKSVSVQALRARPRASRSPATRSRSMSAAGSRTWNSTSSAINQYVRLSRDAALQRSRQRASSTHRSRRRRTGCGRPWPPVAHAARCARAPDRRRVAACAIRTAQVSPPGEGRGAKCALVVAGPAMRSRRKMRQSSRAGSQATRYQRWLACATPCGSTMRELAWPRPSR